MAQNALKELVQMRDTAAEARSEPYQFEQFEQEGRGLVPMARRSVRVADVAARLSRVAAPLETMRADPDLRALAENQPRVVDIAMQRLETSPLLESVDSHVALAPGTKYRLRVHIGTPLPDTLITGTRPSVDVILPDTTDERGHMLDVVVQGKDFTVTSQRSMPLQLPRFGNSEPVYFTVRTPRQTGPAALRVHFYYQNHLVQSYLLQSAIEPQETPLNDDVLRVTLAYTRVKKLEDSTHLKSRAFSVAANAGAGTHELILKGSANAAAEVELGNTTYDVEVRRFRRLLDTAARDPVNPANGRVYPLVATGAAPSKFVADTIRSFARQGSNLYEAVFRGASRSTPAIRRQLIDLKAKRDQKIQIVRIDDTFVFPWTIVYDYTLPDTLAGAPDPAVCLGTVIGPAGTAVPCAHGADSGVVCVNGFWSIRHDLEELIGRGSDTDPSVTCPAADGVRVVCDATLPDAGKFETAMKSLVPAPNLAVGPAQEAALLDLLWQTPPVRPSILVVIGHMETAVKAGEPDPPRVVLVPSTHWLTRKRLADRALATDAWTQPRSIVMLLACEAMTTTAATVNDFVTSLALAGAAAVVGAEAVVPSDLAMTCAQRLTDALWSHRTLGMAMTDLRRELIYAGNPLAFIFTAVGSVDLMLN
jgi:hypothetical protein